MVDRCDARARRHRRSLPAPNDDCSGRRLRGAAHRRAASRGGVPEAVSSRCASRVPSERHEGTTESAGAGGNALRRQRAARGGARARVLARAQQRLGRGFRAHEARGRLQRRPAAAGDAVTSAIATGDEGASPPRHRRRRRRRRAVVCDADDGGSSMQQQQQQQQPQRRRVGKPRARVIAAGGEAADDRHATNRRARWRPRRPWRRDAAVGASDRRRGAPRSRAPSSALAPRREPSTAAPARRRARVAFQRRRGLAHGDAASRAARGARRVEGIARRRAACTPGSRTRDVAAGPRRRTASESSSPGLLAPWRARRAKPRPVPPSHTPRPRLSPARRASSHARVTRSSSAHTHGAPRTDHAAQRRA